MAVGDRTLQAGRQAGILRLWSQLSQVSGPWQGPDLREGVAAAGGGGSEVVGIPPNFVGLGRRKKEMIICIVLVE